MANERIAETVERLNAEHKPLIVERSKEWWMQRADDEGDHAIGAGSTGETTGRTYTERELRFAQREAWLRGVEFATNPTYAVQYRGQAWKLYPMPKVTRERVISINGFDYRVHGGQLQHRMAGLTWHECPRDAEWAITIAKLIDSPTETVPDEETDGEEQDRR